MKRFSLLTVLFLAVGALYFTACQKDTETTAAPETTSQADQTSEVVDRSALDFHLAVSGACWSGNSCTGAGLTNSKVNNITVLGTTTPATMPPLGYHYKIYNEFGVLLTQFNCSSFPTTYASTSLKNGKTCTIKFYKVLPLGLEFIRTKSFTNGYFNHLSCNGNDQQ